MPPKKKPVQAGKFKPLKRPTTKKAASAAAESNPSTSSSEAAAAATSSTTTSSDNNVAASSTNTAAKTQRSARSKSPKGRGGGRGGRGGRGGGRGGRFIAPTGQAFFTGNAMPGGGSAAAAGTRAARGRKGPAADSSSNNNTNNVIAPKYTATRHAAESAAAAARAREGEGEEIVVMEMDLEDGHDNNYNDQPRKKKSVLEQQDRPVVRDGPSLYDDELLENSHQETVVFNGDAYEYDSDSSIEEEKQQQQQRRNNNNDDGRAFRMAPMRLPFPVAPHQQSMYDCQTMIEDEEKKSSDDADMTPSSSNHQQSSSKLSDPVLESPFVDVNSASDEMKQLETNSWFLMKFPTRLPHVDITGRSSSNSGSKRSSANVKKEMSEGGHDGPDMIGSSIDMNDIMLSSSGSAARGYDDTLKDMPPGKYGRIIVRKSGKTELIIGGGDSGEPEVRMIIHEGLQCGFRQEAVSIDPDEATFVPLGNIKKSIVVTPDVLGNGL